MHSGIGPRNAARIARRKGLQTVETTMHMAVSYERELYKDTLVKYCVPKEQFCALPDNPDEDCEKRGRRYQWPGRNTQKSRLHWRHTEEALALRASTSR